MKKSKKQAAALKYDPQKNGAPVLTAVGEGFVAERILKTALENNIPVAHDAALASVLSRIPPGKEIPPELYRAVAEILVFVTRLDGEYQAGAYKKP